MRNVFRQGRVPEEHADDRALMLHLSFRPQRQPELLPQGLFNLSQTVIQGILASESSAAQLDDVAPDILQQAAHNIVLQDDEPTGDNETLLFNYYGANSPIFHSLLLYAMRPNPRSTQNMNDIWNEMISAAPNTDFDAARSVGLPIRGVCVRAVFID